MLDAMRRGAKTKVMKVILGLLALTFVVFFGSDFSGQHAGDTASPVEVGDRNISVHEVSREFNQQVQRFSQLLGQRLDTRRAIDAGLLDQAVSTLVSRSLFTLAAEDLGVTASQEQTARRIRELPGLQDSGGRFSRALFENFLASAGLSESQFVGQAHEDMVRAQYLNSLRDGTSAPAPLLDLVLRYRTERRIADVLTIEADKLPAPGRPDEAQLSAFYEQNKEAFRKPETRTATILQATPESLAAAMQISEDDLRLAYEERLDQYITPEKRAVAQGNFADRDSAQRAAELIDGGTSFADAIEEVSGLPPIDLGSVARYDIALPDLADAVFATPENGIAGPVESPLGWHLAQVTEITPEYTASFEEVLPDLNAELAADRARDDIFELLNAVLDGLAGGAALEDVARENGLDVQIVTDINRAGQTAGGTPLDLAPAGEIVAAVFATPDGEIGELVETPDGGFFVTRTDSITESALQPLTDIREDAVAAWQENERRQAAEKKAGELAEKLRGGAQPNDLSGAGVTFARTEPFDRRARDGQVAPAVASAVFSGKPGDIVQAPTETGYAVARIVEIAPPEENSREQRADLRAELDQALRDETVVQIAQALERHYTVDVNRIALEQAFAPQ